MNCLVLKVVPFGETAVYSLVVNEFYRYKFTSSRAQKRLYAILCVNINKSSILNKSKYQTEPSLFTIWRANKHPGAEVSVASQGDGCGSQYCYIGNDGQDIHVTAAITLYIFQKHIPCTLLLQFFFTLHIVYT